MTQPKYKNKFATHKTFEEKKYAYWKACFDSRNQATAYRSDGSTTGLICVDVADVEFIGGLWRVQEPFPHKIQRIRDKDVVLAEKLPHIERIPFEYYCAYTIGENCYGKYLLAKPDLIVAKYQTDDGVYWGYGDTIEQARAFLGIKLFDEYMNVIHAAACRDIKVK